MLLDTCIAIDLIRGDPRAVAAIDRLDKQPFASVVTVAELFAGFRSQSQERIGRRFFAGCRVLAIDAAIAERGGSLLRHYKASHDLDIADALIAATAEQHGLRLATLNVKHFPMFPRLKPAY